MSFLTSLEARHLVQDVSDPELDKKLGANDSFYVGFDPTSPNLHIGNLLQIIVSIHVARITGMRPIILFGGSTGSIGDPSGKANERQLLTRDVIEKNVASHSAIAQRLFERAGLKAEFVDNFQWTRDLSVLDFLRDIGKHFTVNYMIAKEVVKTRLNGEGISYTEFSYMLLQAYDYLHLYKTKGCRLQFGGSDQWGNITSGLELIRRSVQGDAFAFSVPLCLDSEGKKLGKTAAGAVWINADGLSPYEFHQYWYNVSDADVKKLLTTFTFIDLDEIESLCAEHASAPEKRLGQSRLADEITKFVHGEQALTEANAGRSVLFGGDMSGLSEEQLLKAFSGVPSSEIDRAALDTTTVLDIFVGTKLTPSKGEARRLIQNNGAYLNNERLTDGTAILATVLDPERKIFVLRSGKKNYHLVRIRG